MKTKLQSNNGSIIGKIVLFLLIALLVLLGGIAFYVKGALEPVSTESSEVLFTVEEGENTKTVSEALEEAGLVKDGNIAYYYARYKELTNVRAGKFMLDPSMTLDEIYGTLNDPNAAMQDTVSVTLIEGEWCKEMAKKISESLDVSYDELMALWNNEEWIRSKMSDYPFLTDEMFNENVRVYLEGYLAPETYQFFRDATAEEVTCRLLDQTLSVYNEFKDDIEASELSVHQLFTLASIVQYEASDIENMKLVAGVFYNRLAIDMPLQSSVTVCYSIDFDKDVDSWQACEYNADYESPYNTYLYNGLTPGPILNMGKDAIDAVLHPTESDYYYFMTDIDTGVFYYSRTLEEHNANVRSHLNY